MQLPISNQELCQISQEVCGAQPLWGLLKANEYFEASHPLRQALASKAREKIQLTRPCEDSAKVLEKIFDGMKFLSFSPSEQALIRALGNRPTKHRDYTPQQALFNRRREIRKRETIEHFGRIATKGIGKRGERRSPLRVRH